MRLPKILGLTRDSFCSQPRRRHDYSCGGDSSKGLSVRVERGDILLIYNHKVHEGAPGPQNRHAARHEFRQLAP